MGLRIAPKSITYTTMPRNAIAQINGFVKC